MRKSFRQKIETAVAACLMLLLSVCGVYAFASADAAESQATYDNLIAYDAADFLITEDYAAVVPSVSRVTWANRVNGAANPDNDYYQDEYAWQDGVGDVEMRLDAGRTGLLLESKQTGKDAEGTGFAFANTMYGEFSLDFRVFSKESYVGAYGLHNKADAPEYLNTFLDLRIIGFTFTSVSDPTQAFTVYFGGAQLGAATDVVAGVGIAGEGKGMYNSILADVPGYGVSGKNAQRTGLTGTTFSNTAWNEAPGMSSSTKFSFDPVTMRVFAYDGQTVLMGGNRGVRQVENTYLVRDLATNRLGTAADAPVTNMAWVKTLSPEDFAAGYTVEATVVEMTANETPGIWGTRLKNTAVATDLEYDDNAYFSNANAKTVREPYARTAKILLYEVNGQSLQVDEGFEAQRCTFDGVIMNGAAQTAYTGYELTAKAKNAQAEGNVFTVDGEEFKFGSDATDFPGQYMLGVAAIPTQYAAANITQEKTWGYSVERQVPGVGYYDMDPYSDVLQYGVTYRSKSDPSKAFTVHVLSYLACKIGINVCVSIEGENYVNSYGVAGFAQDNGATNVVNGKQVTWLAGTSGRGNNFGVSYNSPSNPYTVLRFDPATMTIYGREYTWRPLRELTRQYTTNDTAAAKLGTTLSADDFADGFTVEVGIERMNTEWNRGRTTVYNIDQGRQLSEMWYKTAPFTGQDYVFEEGYDRQAKIRIISTATGNVDIAEDSLTYSSATTHKGDSTRLVLGVDSWEIAAVVGQTELPLAFSLRSAYGLVGTPASVAYVSADGSDSGTVTLTDGRGTFVPAVYGEYVFSADPYPNRSSIRIMTPHAPVLTYRNPVSEIVYVGAALTVSADDVVVEALYGANDLEITATYNDMPIAYTDVSADKVGVYTVTYRVTDYSGREAKLERRILVFDYVSTAPVVYWRPPHTVRVGDVVSFADITAIDPYGTDVTVTVTAVKAIDGDVETALAFDSETVTVTEAGEIYIYVTATNMHGDTTETVFRTYARGEDVPAPQGGGCGSSVGGAWLWPSLVALSAAIGVLYKRKKKAVQRDEYAE